MTVAPAGHDDETRVHYQPRDVRVDTTPPRPRDRSDDTRATLPLGLAGRAAAGQTRSPSSAIREALRRDAPVPPGVALALERLQNSLMKADGQPRFRPVGILGEGSQGAVYRVSDRDCRREVAFKLLSAQAASAEDVQRFVLEAQITAQLEHPGIVPVHDLGVLRDGTLFYSMKCVDGESLAEHLATRAARADQRFALLEIFLRICQTVAFAHSRGVIHRDLKPKNIMVGTFGEVLIMDWGLAKIIGTEEDSRAIRSDVAPSDDAYRTMVGTAVGTPAYMSPEQAAGEVATLDHRCDVYSLGVLLYEMLAGVSPYERGDVARVLRQAREGLWTPVEARKPDLPRPLAAVVRRAMARERDERYQTVEALARDVRAFLAGDAVSAYRETGPERLSRWMRRHRAAVRGAAAAALATVLIAMVMAQAWRERGHGAAALLRLQLENAREAGDLGAASALCEELLAIDPEDAWAINAAADLARRRAQAQRTADARAEAARLAREAEERASLAGEGELQSAVDRYAAALALLPGDRDLRLRYERAYGQLVEARLRREERQRRTLQADEAEQRVRAAERLLASAQRWAAAAHEHRAEAARRRDDPAAGDRRREHEEAARLAERHRAGDEVEAAEAIEAALRLAPELPAARRLMAECLVLAVLDADRRGDEPRAEALAARARPYDDEGRWTDLLAGRGRVSVPADAPALALVPLAEDRDLVWRPTGTPVPVAAGATVALPRGRWLALLSGRPLQAFALGRGHLRELHLAPAPALPDGVAWIPPGEAVDGAGRALARVDGFALAVREVTCGEWHQFLADRAVAGEIAAFERSGRLLRVPRTPDGAPLWQRERGGGWRLAHADGRPLDPLQPVAGISPADAEAYAVWRAARDGVAWRLPTRDEWRLAVQGGDGRPYPWGERFDARLCTGGGDPARMSLLPAGSHPADRSVQGVVDLAGSVAEIVRVADGERHEARGGGWRDRGAGQFTADAVRPVADDEVDPAVGVRLAFSP